MARKLSPIARRITYLLIAGAVSLAANTLSAQPEPQTADSPKVADNPFIAAQPQLQQQPPLQSSPTPQTVSEPQKKTPRRQIAYQNPFATASKAPPVDTSLRPGPLSRWRHPVIPGTEPSAIKSVVLSAPAPEPVRRTWDVLPPAEDLRHCAADRVSDTDPTFYARLVRAQSAIQFSTTPLTQPTWLTEFDEAVSRESISKHTEAAVFDSPSSSSAFATQTSAQSRVPNVERAEQVNRAFSLDTIDASPTKSDISPSIISDCVETPAGWLEQAQHAAKDANSTEELSSIVEFCERGLRGTPDEKQSASLRRLSAWAHNRRGEMLADANRADDALSDFQAAISLDQTCSLAIHNRAVTFAQQNQFDAALRDFNRVIELNPGLAVAYRNRAELLAAIGRLEEAISDYNQALGSLPHDAQLYRNRAYAYQQLGEFSKSAADFDRALEIAPSDPDALTQRGNLAAEQGNYEQALADFHRALAADPNWAEAHRSIAWVEATCPDPSYRDERAAVSSAEWAAKLAPANDYLILDTLAAAHASAGHFDKAGDFQQRALACAPSEIAPSMKQRLDLYRNGQPFRNAAAPGREGHKSSGADIESSLPVGALR